MAARQHAFVAMPFGIKPATAEPDSSPQNPSAQMIDFNRVYSEYIRPALEIAGLEPFRNPDRDRALEAAETLAFRAFHRAF